MLLGQQQRRLVLQRPGFPGAAAGREGPGGPGASVGQPAGAATGLAGLRALGPPALAEPLPQCHRPAAAHLPSGAREPGTHGAGTSPRPLPSASHPFPLCWLPHCSHGDGVPRPDSAFPLCQETSPGVPFWAGDRSCPHPLTFNPDNVSAGESCGAPHWGQCGWGESRVCARGTVDAGP